MKTEQTPVDGLQLTERSIFKYVETSVAYHDDLLLNGHKHGYSFCKHKKF